MITDRSPMAPVWEGLYPEALAIHERLRVADIFALIHNRPDCRLRLPADPSRTRVTVSASPDKADAARALLEPCKSGTAVSLAAQDVAMKQARIEAIMLLLAPHIRRASSLLETQHRG